MTKLNWRDAKKELPDDSFEDCVVITRSFLQDGTVITRTCNAYYCESSKKWGHVDNCHVIAWIYASELLPLNDLKLLPEE